MSTPVIFSLGTVPAGFCATGSTAEAQWQSVFTMLLQILSGSVSAASNIVVSQTTPQPADQGKLWVKLNAYGMPIGIFFFGDGQWIWPNPRPSGGGERMIWDGTETALWEYDGGEVPGVDPSVTPPTPTTGAMWQVDTVWQFTTPIGAGTNAKSYNGEAATVLSQGQTGGEEKHVLTMDEILHQHAMGNVCVDGAANPAFGFDQMVVETRPAVPLTPNVPGFVAAAWGRMAATPGAFGGGGTVTDAASASLIGPPVGAVTDLAIAADENHPNTITNVTPPEPTAHNNLPPYRVVYFAKRTTRQFYRGN